jgi:rubredoxin-NAD+ reductase
MFRNIHEVMMNHNPVVIIGSGLAGYMLAKEFRRLDKESPLQIITATDGAFYSKPLLSTALSMKRDVTGLTTATAEAMSKQLNVVIRTRTRVTRIDVENQYIQFPDEILPYSKLILATGSEVIKPSLLGDAVNEILSVNDLEDYARFREMFASKKHVAILGAGLVGCEFANDLANVGHRVDIIDPSYYPLQRLLPKPLGRILQHAFAENNVVWHLGSLASQVDKKNDQYELVLSQQQILKVDVVMSAIGLRPHIELAQKAGIKVNYGILVDRYLQTSARNIYALGDCAEVNGLVLFFVAPLLNCAQALAKTLTGSSTQVVYPAMPVVLKTPLCPIVVAPPPPNVVGDWQVSGTNNDLKALYYDRQQNLCGFSLTGKMVSEKTKLVQELPALLK